MENSPTDFVNPNKKPPRKRRSGFFRGLCLHLFATAQIGQWHFFERFDCRNTKLSQPAKYYCRLNMRQTEEKMKKITLHSELIYFAAILILSFSSAMQTAANAGISMIIAPAYVISQKLTFLTFGQSEYLVQGIVFIAFCILMKNFKPIYLVSFGTCIIYGAALDMWRTIIPAFNPNITVPGSMPMPVRIAMLCLGMIITAFSVALFFHTYLYPQVYDFFVREISKRYNKNRTKLKIAFDTGCLVTATVLSLLFFGKLVGVGVGTLVMTLVNGRLIGFFDKQLDKYCIVKPLLPKIEKAFIL